LSDESLVVEMCQRHSWALAEAYRRHARPAFGLARGVLRSEEHAADVVQDVFLRLWQGPERFDAHRGSLRSYLLTLTHGLAVDVVRSEQSRAVRQRRWARAGIDEYDLGEDVADQDLEQRTVVALQSLTHDERRAISLAYFGGFTYVEVAAILREPEGTIKSRIRSGLGRARKALTAATEDES